MEQKIKLIILGLIVILTISLVFNVLIFTSRQGVARERDTLKEQNAELDKKLSSSIKEAQDLQKKITSLNQNLDKLTRDKDELQKKYEMVDKARENLVEQIKKMKKEGEPDTMVSGSTSLSADAYWAGVLKQKKDMELQLDKLRSELKNVQINNEQLQKEKSSLDLETDNINRDKQDIARKYEFLQKQLEYHKKMVDSLSLELVGEKNDKLKIEDTLKTVKNENTVLRRQLKSINDRKINLEKKLANAQEKADSLEKKFDEMDILLQDRTIQVEKLNKQLLTGGKEQQDSVELSPIVVRPQSESPLLGSAGEGRVVAVNRENNFVIIDLGQDSGVRVGDTFGVYNKENKQIAAIEVIETRKSISACDIQKESAAIQVQDKVRVK